MTNCAPSVAAAVAVSRTLDSLACIQYCLSCILCLAHALQQRDMASSQVMLLVQVDTQGLECLSAASVLQKLCLFNCKLGQEASDTIVSCFKDKGFLNLRELDLTGNEIEAPQMQSVLEAVQQQGVAPALKVHCYSVVPVYTHVWQLPLHLARQGSNRVTVHFRLDQQRFGMRSCCQC